MTRLGEWRNSDIESYQSAYVSLVLHRFHIDQWSFSCSILCQLTALLCQDILANCATSPAVLVSIHINCCYIGTALVLSGAKSSTIVTIKILKSRASFSSDLKTSQWLISKPFSSPLTASARRRPWTSSLKIPTDFSSPPLLRRLHNQFGGFVSHLTFDWRWWLQSWWPLSALVTTRSQQTRLKGWSVACRGPCKTSHP